MIHFGKTKENNMEYLGCEYGDLDLNRGVKFPMPQTLYDPNHCEFSGIPVRLHPHFKSFHEI